MTGPRDDEQAASEDLPGGGEPHVADDLARGQGPGDAGDLPAEDVADLAGIEDPVDQDAVAAGSGLDRLGEMTPTAIYEGELEARVPDSDQPDDPEIGNVESLLERELRAGETDNPDEAAEEGLTWVPPTDPPVVPGELGQPEVAAGFGTTADDEPFDADHHDSALAADDEASERIREALIAHAATSTLVDRLQVTTLGSRVVVAGRVADLADEEAVLEVVSGVDGVTDVDNRIEIEGLERP